MPEFPSSTILTLLIVTVCLLALSIGLLIGVFRRLTRMERLLTKNSAKKPEESRPLAVDETPSGGAFEAFLNEDPERRNMSKKDCFAAFRSWRQERGLNWSNSGD